MSDVQRASGIDVKMLELLACPLTKGPLVWDAGRAELVSKSARLAYPVRDGIPVMLPSEARTIDPDDAVSRPETR
ncbi:Trm112 family protein [Mesorhizobium sp. KR9-304]|uniref:Trm112 family protein n=1 Tax=Mesorhizobium sp. KR9-304 TaxID=3156614 RepID=UPI0032B440F8